MDIAIRASILLWLGIKASNMPRRTAIQTIFVSAVFIHLHTIYKKAFSVFSHEPTLSPRKHLRFPPRKFPLYILCSHDFPYDIFSAHGRIRMIFPRHMFSHSLAPMQVLLAWLFFFVNSMDCLFFRTAFSPNRF